MAKVLLKNVEKSYPNGFRAVKSMNLEVQEGEFVILVGPSGCGKSTALRMIAGLEEISSGELWIDGRLANDLEPGERELSMVFQNYALYPHMNVYENIAFGLRAHKVPREEIDRRVREAARLLQIDHLLERKPGALSGGQKQRVAIGSVLVRQTKLLLMDEPLSNLDAKLRTQMRVELTKLHKQLNAAVIYVTHDQVEAMTMGDRIVVMKEGEIQQIASPKEIYNNPVNQFVAGFIGAPSMNFLTVELVNAGGKLMLGLKDWMLELPEEAQSLIQKKGCQNGTFIMGVRPENLKESACSNVGLPMQVDVRESLGAEVLIHGAVYGEAVCAKMEPDARVKNGDLVWLTPDMDRIHLFDTETGENILYTPASERSMS